MTKVCTHGRSAQLVLQMLDESLRRLQTDHLDLWQIHGIVYDNHPELAYAKGGVLEAFDRAKKEGKTRFVGFTDHKDPTFHLRMLELGYPFDNRRRFLQAGLAATGKVVAGSMLHSSALAAAGPPAMTNTGTDQIPRKPLGRTGEQVSIIGVGGYHLGTMRARDDAVRLVQEAVDTGVTFFDNAWEYNAHRSEEWMGLGLQGRRDRIFFMTKVCTHGRDKKVAMQQLEESLKRPAHGSPGPLADSRGHL